MHYTYKSGPADSLYFKAKCLIVPLGCHKTHLSLTSHAIIFEFNVDFIHGLTLHLHCAEPNRTVWSLFAKTNAHFFNSECVDKSCLFVFRGRHTKHCVFAVVIYNFFTLPTRSVYIKLAIKI